MTTFSYDHISPKDLTSLDFAAEIAITYDAFSPGRKGGPIDALRIHIDGDPNVAEALIIDGRIGIAQGGNAEWGDIRGTGADAIESAIDDYINDVEAWEARN